MYVSCEAKTIYRAGGWFEDGNLLNELSLGDASRLGPRFIAELYAPYCYRRPMPVRLSATETFRLRLYNMYATINEHYRAGAAAALVCIENACVHNSTIYMTGDDRTRVIYETHRPNDRKYAPLKQPAELARSDTRFLSTAEDCYLIMASIGSRNYGHWIIDDLPRIKAFHTLRKLHPKKSIIILLPSYNSAIDNVRRKSIEVLLSREKRYAIEFYDSSIVYSFANLYYVTPVSYHPMIKSPAAMSFISGSVATLGSHKRTDVADSARRIFVTRRDTRGRALVNGQEIEALLKKKGFLIVDPEEMLFDQQVQTFASANVIVGCMGAAMANTVFSDVATSIVMLAPEDWHEPFYWDLATARGHSYSVCYGRRNAPADVPHESSYEIEPDILTNMLSPLL